MRPRDEAAGCAAETGQRLLVCAGNGARAARAPAVKVIDHCINHARYGVFRNASPPFLRET